MRRRTRIAAARGRTVADLRATAGAGLDAPVGACVETGSAPAELHHRYGRRAVPLTGRR
ncbi:hypothetical protein [Streptomyces sp. NPDC089795]|uniref:hypothetical protein n=1 Tax=Streptomyces sp. NPDC089795 TaxID=3155297 RepID=UPI00342E237E